MVLKNKLECLCLANTFQSSLLLAVQLLGANFKPPNVCIKLERFSSVEDSPNLGAVFTTICFNRNLQMGPISLVFVPGRPF